MLFYSSFLLFFLKAFLKRPEPEGDSNVRWTVLGQLSLNYHILKRKTRSCAKPRSYLDLFSKVRFLHSFNGCHTVETKGLPI